MARTVLNGRVRILHVGWGFSPWRPGGLIFYAEDLMAAQAARGHEVSYLLSGRHYPGVGGPRLRRWRRDGVAMLEVVNSPIVVGLERGTRAPLRDVEEPALERIFERTLAEARPDVLHVQELLGFPSSILDLARAAGVPVVMTLQDYFPLCATVRLYDSDGRVCMRREIGADCALRNAEAPADASHLMRHTMHFELARAKERIPGLRRASFAPLRPIVEPAVRLLAHRGTGEAPELPGEDFQHRRDVNIDRLGRVDRLIAQSTRVEEIYRALGVENGSLTTLHLTLAHLERIRPREPREPATLTFATPGGFIGPSKGSGLMVETLERLHAAGHAGRFRLRVLGSVHPTVAPRLAEFPELELAGEYDRFDLDGLLADVDVGIMPSVWEEAYGFAGLELLAKGIPVAANRIGGMVDYVREGETGWLNDSCDAEGMARILARLIEHPAEVADRSRSALAARAALIKPFEAHVAEIEATYREAGMPGRGE
jgi:glycosyltransferase involved in cell wall biosynthesis